MRQDVRAACRLGSLGVAQHGSDFVIGQARGRMDDGRIELVSLQLALVADDGVAHEGQTVDGRIERAQAIRQLFRQHGNHAAREVHGRAAFERVDIERVVRLHVMADVGNGDDQAEAVGAAHLDGFAIHGIVEVARILAVDGDERHVAQVDTVFQVGGTHFEWQLFRLLQGSGGKDVRHVEFTYSNLDFHAGVIQGAQHFDDLADGLLEAHGLLRQLDADDLPRLRLAHGTGDEDILADALVFRRHHPVAVFLDQATDDVGVGPLRDFHDRAFRAATAVGADDAGHDLVAMQYFLHFFLRQEQVGAGVVGNDEAESIAVAGDAAGDECALVGQREDAAGIRLELAVALHRLQATDQDIHGIGMHLQRFPESLRIERRVDAAEYAENVLPAGDGVGILAQKYFYSCY